jgi:4-amino-4-deoxy-L-arabinose transferase-like glycosyltransferase
MMSLHDSPVCQPSPRIALSYPGVAAVFWIGLLLTGICKLLKLQSRELWLDESYSAYTATHSFSQIVRASAGDLNPPLFHLLLHAWVRLAGDSESHLRLFSVLISFIAAAVVFFTAKRILGLTYGVLAGLLFALSPMLFVYSFEVRTYVVLILAIAVAINLHWRVVLERSTSKAVFGGYAVALAALFYLHYLSIFLLAGLLLHALWVAVRFRGLFLHIALVVAAVLLLLAPGIRLLTVQRANATRAHQIEARANHDPQSLVFGIAAKRDAEARVKRNALPVNYAAMLGFYPATSKWVFLLAALPLIAAAGLVFYLALVKHDPLCQLLLIVAVSLTCGILAFKAYSTRYLLPLVPLAVLAMARVVQRLAPDSRGLPPSLGPRFSSFMQRASHGRRVVLTPIRGRPRLPHCVLSIVQATPSSSTPATLRFPSITLHTTRTSSPWSGVFLSPSISGGRSRTLYKVGAAPT